MHLLKADTPVNQLGEVYRINFGRGERKGKIIFEKLEWNLF